MDENCTHDCSDCGVDCSSREASPQSFIAPANKSSNIKNVIGVVSGKGGVGKSLVTALMTSKMNSAGYKTAVLDADITGPSIPKIFGVEGHQPEGDENGLMPAVTRNHTKIMSVNLLLDSNTTPVIWRGPVVAGVVKQFWTDVAWGEIDYMFVDMPPGTGDVPLTVFQSLPIKGILIVTSPQELVGMIVEKAVKMAEMMNVPVLGIVENMSYFRCDECEKEHHIFGESHIDEIAAKYGIENIAKLPMDPEIAALCDKGKVEKIDAPWLDSMAKSLANEG